MNRKQLLFSVLVLIAGLAIGYAGVRMVNPAYVTVTTTTITTSTTATTTTARITSTIITTSTFTTTVTNTTTPKVLQAGNVMQLHLNTATVSSGMCKWCHDVTSEVSLRPDVKTPHSAHLSSDLLKLECNTCHKAVDLNEKSAASLRKQVDTAFCAKCHFPFSKKMDAAYQKMDCTTCHSNWKDKMGAKAASFVNMDLIKPKDCIGCHGGRAWYVGGS